MSSIVGNLGSSTNHWLGQVFPAFAFMNNTEYMPKKKLEIWKNVKITKKKNLRRMLTKWTEMLKSVTDCKLPWVSPCINFLWLCKEQPQTWAPKTLKIYPLTDLEARGLKSRCWRTAFPPRLQGGTLFFASLSLWWLPASLGLRPHHSSLRLSDHAGFSSSVWSLPLPLS